jgi:hypothetical protein
MAAWGSKDIGLCADKRRPRYKVGDILYIRETWAPGCMGGYIYKAGHEYAERLTELKQWKPSIHMLKEAARIFIEITAVKAERIQDITEEDARAEGLSEKRLPGVVPEDCGAVLVSARGKFHALWDKLNAKAGHGWEKNDWVFAYTFRRIEAED